MHIATPIIVVSDYFQIKHSQNLCCYEPDFSCPLLINKTSMFWACKNILCINTLVFCNFPVINFSILDSYLKFGRVLFGSLKLTIFSSSSTPCTEKIAVYIL